MTRIYVLGNGESRFAPNVPETFPGVTIGCNVAALGHRCDVAVALDLRVYRRHRHGFRFCGAACIYVDAAPGTEEIPDFVMQIPASADHGWTDRIGDGLLCHSNTGLTAIHYASIFDPKAQIVLVGFDMKAPGKLTTDGGGLYPEGERTHAEDTYRTMMDAFRFHAKSLARFNIVNTSLDSDLTMFPKVDLREVM